MKIYIAGPMTGRPYFNFPDFDQATENYRRRGWFVFSPAEHDRKLLGKEVNWLPSVEDTEGPWLKWSLPNSPSLREMLGADLSFIAYEADAIHMLKGWEKSAGARAEHATASVLGLQIFYG